jgi:hypothetical protein
LDQLASRDDFPSPLSPNTTKGIPDNKTDKKREVEMERHRKGEGGLRVVLAVAVGPVGE